MVGAVFQKAPSPKAAPPVPPPEPRAEVLATAGRAAEADQAKKKRGLVSAMTRGRDRDLGILAVRNTQLGT